MIDKEVAAISPEDLLAGFGKGVQNVVAVSLETGYTVSAAVPHMLINAFKNLCAVSAESGYKLAALE